MFGLRRDVCDGRRNLRHADGKCPVAILPRALQVVFVVQPFRGAALEQLDRVRYRDNCGNGQQRVDMVVSAADGERLHSIGACNSTQVGPEIGLNAGGDSVDAQFGREHDMDRSRDVGMGHERNVKRPVTGNVTRIDQERTKARQFGN